MSATPITYYYSTRPQWMGVVFALLAALFSALLLAGFWPELALPAARWMIALPLLVLASWALYRLIPHLHDRKPAMSASLHGLWFAAYEQMGVIPWQAISEILPAPDHADDDGIAHPGSSILINLHEPERWYAKMPPTASQFLRSMQRLYGTNLVFDCWALEYAAPRRAIEMCAQLNQLRAQALHQPRSYPTNPFVGRKPLEPPSPRLV